MHSMLETTISLLIGSVIVIGGVHVLAGDLIADAKEAVAGANLHQLATALELYYVDHGNYPAVAGGKSLVVLLENNGYIRNKPQDAKHFLYEARADGQDYTLRLVEE